MTHIHQRAIAASLITVLLAGCQFGVPGGIPGTAVGTKKLTPQEGLARLKNSGKVQLSFKGLAARQVMATSDDIDTVTVELAKPNGEHGQRKSLTRKELLAPAVTVNFDGVPAGETRMRVMAFDRTGRELGHGEEHTQVKPGQTSKVSLAVRLDALPSGSVSADITFEETAYESENLTGQWVLGLGAEPPVGPVIGCNMPNLWTVHQNGKEIYATTSGRNGADHPLHPNVDYLEIVQGTFHNRKLKLKGDVTYYDFSGQRVGAEERVRYEVDYNPETGHIVGLRNDQQGWAAPYMTEETCYGSPVPGYTPWPSPSVSPTPTWVPSGGWTPLPPSATPTPWSSFGPGGGGTPPPVRASDMFRGLSAKRFVAMVFELYDNDLDGRIDYTYFNGDEDTVKYPYLNELANEMYRYESVDTRDSMGYAHRYTTGYTIISLLRGADPEADHRVTMADVEALLAREGFTGDQQPDDGFHNMYGETVVSVDRY
jgi:hypothetical protein